MAGIVAIVLAACGGSQVPGPTSSEPTEGLECGEQTCDVGEYCTLTYPGSTGDDLSATCSVLPENCEGAGDCACIGADTYMADMRDRGEYTIADAMCFDNASGATLELFMPCPWK